MGGADLGNWSGLGAGAVLLVLIFRTLWKLSTDSSELARNYDAALDRAQHDAAEARTDAAQARLDAAKAAGAVVVAERKVLDEQRRAVELEATLRRERLELEIDLRRQLAELEVEVARLRVLVVRDSTAQTRETDTNRPPADS